MAIDFNRLREDGRKAARYAQALRRDHPEECCNQNEWNEELLSLTNTRDTMATSHRSGNPAAGVQWAFLDGFLSVWD